MQAKNEDFTRTLAHLTKGNENLPFSRKKISFLAAKFNRITKNKYFQRKNSGGSVGGGGGGGGERKFEGDTKNFNFNLFVIMIFSSKII